MSGKLIAASVLMLTARAACADPLLYIGGGVGHSQANNVYGTYDLFNISDVAKKAIIGLQPVSFGAIEANYIDLGSGDKGLSHGTAHVDANAVGLYAMGFLPLVSKRVDLFGKLGMARESVTAQSYTVGHFSDHSVHAAWGLGVRAHTDRLAVRLEYERIPIVGSSNGANVVSIAATLGVW